MALLKSASLIYEELQQQIADECYSILEDWQSQGKPIMVPIVHGVCKAKPVDTKPFGFDYGHLPSRNSKRYSMWSEI